MFCSEDDDMEKRAYRLLTGGLAVLGFAALVFLPPMCTAPSSTPNVPIPAHELIRLAWCIAITASIFGLGLGLFLGSFLRLKTGEQNRAPHDLAA